MSNEDDLGNAIMESVKYRILDEVFGLDAIDWPSRRVIVLCRYSFALNEHNRYRTKTADAIPPPPISRDKNAEAPAVPYAALAGVYTHAAYGTIDFCLFWEDATTGSSCAAITEDSAAWLPDVVQPEVPTLIARWATMATNYVRLAHYAGNVFNLTALQSYVRAHLCVMRFLSLNRLL